MIEGRQLISIRIYEALCWDTLISYRFFGWCVGSVSLVWGFIFPYGFNCDKTGLIYELIDTLVSYRFFGWCVGSVSLVWGFIFHYEFNCDKTGLIYELIAVFTSVDAISECLWSI